MIPMVLSVGIIQTSCFGSFSLTKKAYEFVDGIGGDDLPGRFVRTLVMYAGYIVPVWGIAMFVDVVILNLIEFWTGSNPVAMKAGEVETQYVALNGKDYKITATQNEFRVDEFAADEIVETTYLRYCEDDRSWTHVQNGVSTLIAQIENPTEHSVKVDVLTSSGMESHSSGLIKLEEQI